MRSHDDYERTLVFGDDMTLQDSINDIGPVVMKLIEQRDAMRDLLILVRSELDDRREKGTYTRWMSDYIEEINKLIPLDDDPQPERPDFQFTDGSSFLTTETSYERDKREALAEDAAEARREHLRETT